MIINLIESSFMKHTFLIFCSILLILFSPVSFSGQYNSIINLGDKMPEFSKLPSVSGNAISSSHLNDEIIVLVSLANHCPWVRGMDKDLVKLSQLFSNDSVRVIGFSVNHQEDDRLPAMVKHAKQVGYSFDYVYDESQQLGRNLGATRTPEYFIFNKDRRLVYMGALHDSPAKMNHDNSVKHINGEPQEYYVRNAIRATLSGEDFNPKETRAHGCSVKYVQ